MVTTEGYMFFPLLVRSGGETHKLKKLKHHSFFGNPFYHWLSGYCNEFLVFFTQDLIVNCLTNSVLSFVPPKEGMRLFDLLKPVGWPLTIASGSGMMDKMWLNRAAALKVILWDLYHGRGTISRRSHRVFYSEPGIKAVGD
jgi:hypothetical protein